MNSSIKDSYIAVYWAARKETKHECAARLAEFIRLVGTKDTVLRTWFKKGAMRSTSMSEIDPSPESLMGLLESNRKDIGGGIISELGFRFAAWNGRTDETAVSLSATCGAHTDRIKNSVVLSFNPTHHPSADLMRDLLSMAATVFDADDGVATSLPRDEAADLGTKTESVKYQYQRGKGVSVGSA